MSKILNDCDENRIYPSAGKLGAFLDKQPLRKHPFGNDDASDRSVLDPPKAPFVKCPKIKGKRIPKKKPGTA